MGDKPKVRESGTCNRCGRDYSAARVHWYGPVGIVCCPHCDFTVKYIDK